jgi:hypothetical protein
MVKNILLKRALLLGLFVQGVFLFSGLLSAAGVDYAAGLREAFAGRTSFFAISVSRTTERNVESDYPPLTATERFFCAVGTRYVFKCRSSRWDVSSAIRSCIPTRRQAISIS